MKTKFNSRLLAAVLFLSGIIAAAGQNNSREEVPGDNFSLEGALALFKQSTSPQDFEQLLNSPDSKVNNLDLNGDGDIDYIRVIDRNEGNIHIFALQAAISASEYQDVAVIELEKRSDGTAVLQIVGDADIYGIETIIEPTEEVRVNAGTTTTRSYVNVWAWPSVQYIYGPSYTVWVSPWRWSYYPAWYRPWRPLAWAVYDPYWAPYRPYYSLCYWHRVSYAPQFYRPYRTTSVVVYNRHYNTVSHFRSTRGSDYYANRGYHRNDRGSYSRYDNDRSRSNSRSYNNGSNRSYDSRSRTGNSRPSEQRNFERSSRTRDDKSTSPSTPNSSGRTRSFESRTNDRNTAINRSTERNNSNSGSDRNVIDRNNYRRSNPSSSGDRQFQSPSRQRSEAPARQYQAPSRQSAPSGGGGGQRYSAPSRQQSAPQMHSGGGGSRHSGGSAPSGGGSQSAPRRGRN